jgi:hypothetical protein
MSKKIYALVDSTLFKAGNKSKTKVPNFPKIFEADGITPIPNTCQQTISITRKFDCNQNYCKTCINIYCAVHDGLDSHIGDAYKVSPPTSPPTIQLNSTMTLNEIFDQLMVTYGKPTPDAMPKQPHFSGLIQSSGPSCNLIQEVRGLPRDRGYCKSAVHQQATLDERH